MRRMNLYQCLKAGQKNLTPFSLFLAPYISCLSDSENITIGKEILSSLESQERERKNRDIELASFRSNLITIFLACPRMRLWS